MAGPVRSSVTVPFGRSPFVAAVSLSLLLSRSLWSSLAFYFCLTPPGAGQPQPRTLTWSTRTAGVCSRGWASVRLSSPSSFSPSRSLYQVSVWLP